MYIVSMDLTPNELNFVRQALDLVSIKGTDAKFLASLQIKIETELTEIQQLLTLQEAEKQAVLQELIEKELAEIQRLAEEEERRKVEIQQQIISTETVKSSTKK